ncbi:MULTISPECIES: Fic family protein [Pseudoalteromonas]|uniref:Fido domain-containing protein n=1 Tax=Pseudoalteromonas amylolytica TaxID=1859457 RepID=A0A1S1MV88_9GAMM|nr:MULTISPECIES: Fic family protein [Pseudoalteromonas]OHU88042.1 hypothetical protein BFC16_11655 [Pseudoalteromonas sp. JW3]OHU91482.1 hypothetical protein BET10_11775 [Pseudoalteromonas amylolytica]
MASFETLTWHTNQQPYQSYVPDMMLEKPIRTSQRLRDALEQLNRFAISSDHKAFFNRYLSGNVSLREGTGVTHKQLALCSAGIPTKDSIVRQLWSQMYKFQLGCDYATKLFEGNGMWQIPTLLELHCCLAPEAPNSGQLRMTTCWIGGKCPTKARFVAASPQRLESLMEDWLSFVNEKAQIGLENILLAYDQFLVVHPFSDGNGRVSRVFMESALNHLRQGYWLHPLFFRLANSAANYIHAHNAYQRDELEPWLAYWEDAFEWLVEKQKQIKEILRQCELQVDRALLCSEKPPLWDELKAQLYKTPIINMEVAHQYTQSVTLMIQSGVLQVKHVSEMNNMTVLECPSVFEMWQKWEESLLVS